MTHLFTNKFITRLLLIVALLSMGLTAKADFEINGVGITIGWSVSYSDHTCTFQSGWAGMQWVLNGYDPTPYTGLTVYFTEGTPKKCGLKVEYQEGTSNQNFPEAGATSIHVDFEAGKHINKIYLQAEEACSVTIDHIVLVGATTYALTLTNDGNGTASSNQADNAAIAEGASVTVTATPSDQYKFVRWEDGEGNAVSTAAAYTFTMNADKTLHATFAAAQQYALTLAVDDAAHGNVTGAGTYYEGSNVTIKATPATGYRFVRWVKGGNTFSSQSPFTFAMPSEATSLTAEFAESTGCEDHIQIECETFVPVTIVNAEAATALTSYIERNSHYDAYGEIDGDAFVDLKNQASEIFMPFSVYAPAASHAANCTFTVRYANVSNGWVNIWRERDDDAAEYDIEFEGRHYYKYGYFQFSDNKQESWQTSSAGSTWSVMPGKSGHWLVSLYANDYAALDYITITSADSRVTFCPYVPVTHTLTVSADDAAHGTVTPTTEEVAENNTTTVTATAADGFAFVCWEAVSGTTLTEAQLTQNPLHITMGEEDIELVANYASAYIAWPWNSRINSWNVSNVADEWSNQVALGPEHFTTAVVGGKILVKVTNMESGAQGAFQNTTGYTTIDASGMAYDATSGNALSAAYANDNGVAWDFDLQNGDFYHIITATSLAELKENGVIIKGQNYTISQIQVIGTCDHRDMRSTPNVELAEIVYDYSGDVTTNEYVWYPGYPDESKKGNETFAFGNWENKLKFDKSSFQNVGVGDIIRISIVPEDPGLRTRISYRCDTTDIMADAQQGDGTMVNTTGDIEFDRTITNLGGDAPDPQGFVDLYVDADILERLQQTGLIIFGENALLSMVELNHGPYIIREDEQRYIPKCGVDHLIIYQGGQALNIDPVTIYNKIEYIRPAVGGAHGNMLSHWYTFTVPFTVDNVVVEEEGVEYPINAVYHLASDTDPDDPQGAGHYYLQYLKEENVDGYDEIFRARWDYISTDTPQKGDALIILFKDMWGDQYFAHYPTVKFVGGRQTINGKAQAEPVASDGVEKFYYYPNNTMHNMRIEGSAYVLNESTNLFELTDNPVIAPFECYVQATDGYKALHHVLGIGRRNPSSTEESGTATSLEAAEQMQVNAGDEVRVYSAIGQLIGTFTVTEDGRLSLDLPRGCYIVRSADKEWKVML